jgi:tRNA-dihydrouridine synthase B
MIFENKVYLAPLSQYTNLMFRVLCSEYGADATIVPLVCARAICAKKREVKELDPHNSEKCVGVQLFGSRPEDIRVAAKHITENHSYVNFIDLNCACPVRKIISSGAGAALLRDPMKTAELINAAGTAGLPVSIKIRKHISNEKTLAFCKVAQSAGAAAIFIHGRTQSQAYSGDADWSLVKYINENIDIPVIGSGDIQSMAQGRELAKNGYCSGFMIGRAAMGDPEIFSSPDTTTPKRKYNLFMQYMRFAEKFNCLSIGDLRAKALQFFSGFNHSSSIRRKISESKSIEELMEILKTGNPKHKTQNCTRLSPLTLAIHTATLNTIGSS